MKNNKLFYEFKTIAIITIGMLFLSLGTNLFLVSNNLYTTGLLGFSQELATILIYAFKLPDLSSILFWLINVPIIILGWFKVGKRFTIRSFYAVTIVSIFTSIIPTNVILIDDKILSVVTGSILIGLGIGLALRVGGSSGGLDIVALYISIFKGKSFGTYNTLVNILVIVLAILIQHDLTIGVLMFLSLFIISLTIDNIHNNQQKLTLFVVTKHADEIRNILLENFVRGMTIIDSHGGLSLDKNTTLMITIDKGELYRYIDTIKKEDPNAFINVFEVKKLIGTYQDNYIDLL